MLDCREWITHDTLFGFPLDDVFSYRTVKVVRIQDRVLGFVALLLKLAVAAYIVLYLGFSQHGYLEYEPLSGTTSAELSGSIRGVNMSDLAYCQGDYECRLVDSYSAVAADPDPDSIFITTFMAEREQKRICAVDAPTCPYSSPFHTLVKHEYYTAGVDEMMILISHEAQATNFFRQTRDPRFQGDSDSTEGTVQSYRDDGTGRNQTLPLKDLPPGVPFTMLVSEVLNAAGLNLDQPLPGSTHPIRRTGAVINCFITYSNTWDWISPAEKMTYKVEFSPAVVQTRKVFYDPVGFGVERMLVERNGIRLVFKLDGVAGMFSWLACLRTLVTGMLLLWVVTWALDMVATRFLPLSYKYEAAKYEFTENLYNMRASRQIQNDKVLGAVPPPSLRNNGWTAQSARSYAHSRMLATQQPSPRHPGYGAVPVEEPRSLNSVLQSSSHRGSLSEGRGNLPPPMYPSGESI